MATIKDIANRAGVSIATVSKVLSGDNYKISEATRAKVVAIADELHYAPNLLARNLVNSRSSIIGLLIPNISNPYFADVASSIIAVAESNGYQVILCTTGEQSEKEINYVKMLRSYAVAGVIAAPKFDLSNALPNMLEDFDLPYVLIDNHRENCPHNIYVDDYLGFYTSTQHLIECGHQKIAYIGGESTFVCKYQRRYDGFAAAMNSRSLPIDSSLVCFGSYSQDTGYEYAKKMLEENRSFSAIVCGNDMIAIGAIRALQDKSVQVPDDVSIIGYDDIYLATVVQPNLTTVKQPAALIGGEAVLMLLKQINGVEKHPAARSLSPALIIRNSVKRLN